MPASRVFVTSLVFGVIAALLVVLIAVVPSFSDDPPPAVVKNLSGQTLHVGDVAATLTPDGAGNCIGQEGVVISSDEGGMDAAVDLQVNNTTCEVVVATISPHPRDVVPGGPPVGQIPATFDPGIPP